MLRGMQLHSRNQNFHWRRPEGPFRRLLADHVQAFDADGGFCLPAAFTAAELVAVLADLDRLEAETTTRLRQQEGGRFGIARADEITFSPHLVARAKVLRDFSRHPVLLDLVHDLIGKDARLYWDQAVYKKPGTTVDFPWHQDNGYTFVEPQQYLTCWVALTDATRENGCPWIMPGLHRMGTLRHNWTDLGFDCFADGVSPGLPEPRPLELEAGSVAVFSSLTPHRTGPNLTGSTRKAYILQYAPDGAIMYPRDADPLAAANVDWQYPVLIGGDSA